MINRSLTILMVLDRLGIGGTETHVISLTQALIQQGHKVLIAAGKGELYESFARLGCELYDIHFELNEKSPTSVKKKLIEQMDRLFRQRPIDIVHIHQTPSGEIAAIAAAKYNIPVIFTVHGTYYPMTSIIAVCKQSSAIISVSKPVHDFLQLKNIQSHIVPNGIDLQDFYPSKEEAIWKNMPNIADSAKIILYVSRIAWGKATICDHLIRAVKDVRNKGNPQFHLLVVGSGPGMKNIQKLVDFVHHESKQVFIHLLGEQSHNLRQIYNNSHCVVGTGRVSLEAMACGKPVLAVGNHGFFGWVDPSNFEQAWEYYFGDHNSISPSSRHVFSKSILEGFKNEEKLQLLGQSCLSWVRDRFDIRKIVLQVENVYHSTRKDVV